MSNNRLWHIRLLEILHLLVRQGLASNITRLINPRRIAASYDRYSSPLNNPRQTDLTHLPPFLFCQFLHPLDDRLVRLRHPTIHHRRHRRVRSCCLCTKWSRQKAAEQRRPGDQPHARFVAVFVHLALLLAVAQTVVVLHADELGPAVALSDGLHLGELVCPHGAGTDVADLARLDEVVEGFHRLFDKDCVVVTVDLEQVNVVGAETLEGGIDCGEDGRSGQTWDCQYRLENSYTQLQLGIENSVYLLD